MPQNMLNGKVGAHVEESAFMRLRIGQHHDSDSLLARYSPELVVYREDLSRDNPPWPLRTHDYHPRTVWCFIDQSRLTFSDQLPRQDDDRQAQVATLASERAELAGSIPAGPAPGLWHRLAYVGRTVEGYDVCLALGLLFLLLSVVAELITGEFDTWAIGAMVVGMAFVAGGGAWRFQETGTARHNRIAIRERLEKVWPLRLTTCNITLDSLVDAQAAWTRYRLTRLLDENYPRAVYGRTVRVGHLVAMQYWLFFYYNHWRNVHEADWEVLTLIHDLDTNAIIRIGVSSHYLGRQRSPDAVDWHGTHPLVYVAVGSHALYFESRPEGYDPSMTLRTSTAWVRSQTQVSVGSSRDWVAPVAPMDALSLPAIDYELLEMPEVESIEPRSSSWADWWWLTYGGMWGRVVPIQGPAFQTPKWADPLGWMNSLEAEFRSVGQQS